MKVYFDNAATTKPDARLLPLLSELGQNQYLNADSLYDDAVDVQRQMTAARTDIAAMLGVKADEIIFTSGASEGNNMIIKGLIGFYPKRNHIITTDIEHASVSGVIDYYEGIGYQVDRLTVNTRGELDFWQLESLLKKDTLLVSVMALNNETGTILPIEKIAAYVKANSRAFVHSDMTQALGKVTVSLNNIDFASFSAHKFGGFKGSGFIFKRLGTNLLPLIMGGQQEFEQRAGTSNTIFHILLAKSLKLAMAWDTTGIVELNSLLITGLKEIAGVEINSCNSSPFIVNFSLPGLTSQVAINALAKKGIMISGQSTCSSRKTEYSRVLKNMGFDMLRCRNSIRVSFWHGNTKEEVSYFLQALKEVINEYQL